MAYDGINDKGEYKGKYNEGHIFYALGNCAGNYSGRCSAEYELEEK